MRVKLSKSGLFWLVIILAVSVIIPYSNKIVDVVTSTNEKSLPIYCVETEEKVVSLTFDAAWGDCRLRKY